MPIYEYRCEKCGLVSEFMQKISDPAPEKCGSCGGGPMEKQLSMTSFALKGTGWYVTDFKGGSSAAAKNATANEPAAPAAPAAPATPTTPTSTGGKTE